MSSPPLPPHLQSFAHPLGDVVWAAILKLDAGAQHELLARLDTHLGDGLARQDKFGRKQRAIQALRRAAELLGCSPSRNAYARVRDDTHDPELMAPTTLLSALGVAQWTEALALAGLDTTGIARERVAIVISRSPMRYTEAECIAALRGCADDLGGVPSGTTYRRWVMRPDVIAGPGRRPRTETPFVRFFGSWIAALAAARITSEEVQAYTCVNATVRATSYAYSDPEFVAALREVRDGIGCVPRSTKYMRQREEVIAESFAAGAPRTIPSYGAFLKRYGTWNAALISAGMEPFEGRWTLTEFEGPLDVTSTWTDDQLVAIVREACDDCLGPQTTLEDYVIWRHGKLKERGERNRKRKIPSKSVISSRLGGWIRARRRAYPES